MNDMHPTNTAHLRAAAPTSSRHRRGRRWVLSAGLAATAVVLVVGGILTDRAVPPPPSPASHPVATSPAATDPAGPAPAAATTSQPVSSQPVSSQPVSLTIPAIAVTSDLVGLGMEDDRTVEVPQNAAMAGWYDLGTIPGQHGSAVILGHVDSTEGPAVFFRLHELDPGAQVRVTLEDGSVETFEVDRVETIRNADFPGQRVYAGTPRRPTLAIVTCGGEYDEDLGGYQSNVIAWAEHVGTSPAP